MILALGRVDTLALGVRGKRGNIASKKRKFYVKEVLKKMFTLEGTGLGSGGFTKQRRSIGLF